MQEGKGICVCPLSLLPFISPSVLRSLSFFPLSPSQRGGYISHERTSRTHVCFLGCVNVCECALTASLSCRFYDGCSQEMSSIKDSAGGPERVRLFPKTNGCNIPPLSDFFTVYTLVLFPSSFSLLHKEKRRSGDRSSNK